MNNTVPKKIPERKCVGCAEKKAKNELVRIVRLPDGGGVVLDPTGKRAGRGAYICRNALCLKKARKRLEASLECKIPEDLFEQLAAELSEVRT